MLTFLVGIIVVILLGAVIMDAIIGFITMAITGTWAGGRIIKWLTGRIKRFFGRKKPRVVNVHCPCGHIFKAKPVPENDWIVICPVCNKNLRVVTVPQKGSKADRRITPTKYNLRRTVEIMQDCQHLVNNSENLETVSKRYFELIKWLEYLSTVPEYAIRNEGISLNAPIGETLTNVKSHEVQIFCSAIDRAYKKWYRHAKTLKTARGRENSLSRFYDQTAKIIGDYALPSECFAYLEELYKKTLPDIQ